MEEGNPTSLAEEIRVKRAVGGTMKDGRPLKKKAECQRCNVAWFKITHKQRKWCGKYCLRFCQQKNIFHCSKLSKKNNRV